MFEVESSATAITRGMVVVFCHVVFLQTVSVLSIVDVPEQWI